MTSKYFDNLSGKLLIASPYVIYGDVFYKSLIYVLSHTENGSIGLIVNRLINTMPFKLLFKVTEPAPKISDDFTLPVYLGGPVELGRGFFLHTTDYEKNLLFKFENNLAVSSNTSILEDIASKKGPNKSLFIVGYTGWEPGQLEFEIQNNLWIATDTNHDLIFSEGNNDKWSRALKRLGIEDSYFSSNYGNS